MVPARGCLPLSLGLSIATAPAITQTKPAAMCSPISARNRGLSDGSGIPPISMGFPFIVVGSRGYHDSCVYDSAGIVKRGCGGQLICIELTYHPVRGRCAILWEIALPAASPQIVTGLQAALPISLIVAVVAEMAMGGEGLGGTTMTALCRLTQRLRQHHRHRRGRQPSHQSAGAHPPPPARVAGGGGLRGSSHDV